ncbi:MAG: thymidine phosphorylase [Pirellula sp.]|nr:thymidine phosphorylase [Pirellula sp.]
MIPANIIAKKRDGGKLSTDEIRFMVQGYARGEIPDYQMSAFAMTIFLRKMARDEVFDLTEAMVESGERLNRGTAPRVDKHSTGGLGDKTSLIIAPLLALEGYHVPMISGRGLGITGGTLDKLEAIPGFRTNLTNQEIEAQLQTTGCVITGSTETIAPADRKLYALRDVTATVPSLALIVSSIMSKKIAENLDSLVLDVKVGSGSFQSDMAQAELLLRELVFVGVQFGIKTTGIISNMDQPLGQMIGNAVEVIESIDVLKGGGPRSVRELSIELTARAIAQIQTTESRESIKNRLVEHLANGTAFEKFEQMVAAQGGKIPEVFRVEKKRVVSSDREGVLTEIDGSQIGYSVIEMNGGRRIAGQSINHGVGIKWLAPLGTVLCVGDPIAELYCDSEIEAERAAGMIVSACQFDTKSTKEFPPLWY